MMLHLKGDHVSTVGQTFPHSDILCENININASSPCHSQARIEGETLVAQQGRQTVK